jgi:hypothetical protein
MNSLRKSWGGEVQRVPAGVAEPGAGQGGVQQGADPVDRDGPVLDADLALEQQRHRRVPDAFVDVVGHHQRHGPVAAADPADDRRKDVGQLWRDDQQALGVGLGRGDLQQRHQLAGARQPVLHQAVVAELDQFFDADAGGA